MKTFRLLPLLILSLFLSCSSDDSVVSGSETDSLTPVTVMENDTHAIGLYSIGPVTEGYNRLYIRIADKSTGTFVTNAQISWLPMMQMASMTHSCPFSNPVRTPGTETLYDGFIVFQMPSNESESWSLTINYTIDANQYTAAETITVLPSAHRRVNAFMANDANRYVIAMAGPADPQVGLNQMHAVVYRMVTMNEYAPVDDFVVAIDPRMPGMGNHGSPNNTDLYHNGTFYQGTLSLTMTGYWRINLILYDDEGQAIKGEPVTDANPASSLFFEIEF